MPNSYTIYESTSIPIKKKRLQGCALLNPTQQTLLPLELLEKTLYKDLNILYQIHNH
jgi:hypothetical protein